MTFVAAAIGGAAVLGAGASIYAGNKQAQAVGRGVKAEERMFNKQLELNEPTRQGGLAAQNRLLELLGLTIPTEPAASGDNTNNLSPPRQIINYMRGQPIYSDAPAPATTAAQMPSTAPATPSADFGKYARDFGMSDFQADPGYQFRLDEGLKALDRQAAARGGLISGGALKAAGRYGQQEASAEYQNAFNRYQINRANQLQPLQSLMGAGQSSVNTMSNAAGDFGRSMNEGYQNAANARTSGYVGAANAVTGALGTYLNYNDSQNMLNAYKQKNGIT